MGATLIRAADAPQFEIEGAQITGYASPTRGSEALATWRVALRAGHSSPRHQLNVDETFVVLAGAAEYEVDGGVVRVGAGDALTIQANTSFRIRSVGDEAFVALACVPGGCKACVEGGAPFAPPWSV